VGVLPEVQPGEGFLRGVGRRRCEESVRLRDSQYCLVVHNRETEEGNVVEDRQEIECAI
jgi:hypothetical protein